MVLYLMIGAITFFVFSASIYFLSERKSSSTKHEKQEVSEKKADEADQKPKVNKGGRWRAPVMTALAVIGVFTIVWFAWSKLARPNTPGSGLPLLNGTKIAIERYEGDDYSELPKYEPVAGDYLTYLNTQGEKEVYVVVWEPNGDDQWVASTRGPELYTEQPLSRSTVKSLSIFLGPKSKIPKLGNITVTVDMSKRQSPVGGITSVNN